MRRQSNMTPHLHPFQNNPNSQKSAETHHTNQENKPPFEVYKVQVQVQVQYNKNGKAPPHHRDIIRNTPHK